MASNLLWALAQQTRKVFGLWGWGWNDQKKIKRCLLFQYETSWSQPFSDCMTTASIISHFHEHDLEHFESKLSFIGIGWLDKETIRVCCALFFKRRRSLWGHKIFIVITFKDICMMNLILLKIFFVIWPIDLVVASEDRSDTYVLPCIIN